MRRLAAGLLPGLILLATMLVPGAAAARLATLDPDLLDRAQLIVRAEVLDFSSPVPSAEGQMPWQRIQLRILESFRSPIEAGAANTELLTIRVPGGPVPSAGGAALRAAYSHAPTLTAGSTVYLALERWRGDWLPVDLAAGVAHVHAPSNSVYGDPGLILAGTPPVRVAARGEQAFRSDLRRALRTLDASEAGEPLQSTVNAFELLLSPDDLPPTGCGPNGGNPLRWFGFEGGQTVDLLANESGQIGVPGGGFAEVATAAAAWTNDAGSLVELRYAGTTTASLAISGVDGRSSVSFEDPGNEVPGSYPESSLIALSVAFFDCSQLLAFAGGVAHPIVEVGIVTQDGVGSFLFGNEPDPGTTLEELIGHELGHGLGFAHPCDTTPADPCVGAENDSLMRAVLHQDGRGARLGSDDRAGLFFLYPNPQGSPPVAPGLLETAGGDAGSLRLQWQDRSVDEFAFDIEARSLGGFWSTVASVGRNITTATVNDAGAGEPRLYRVRARGPGGASGPSNEVGGIADSIPGTCMTGDRTLCLNGGRFQVTSRWATATASGDGNRGDLTDDTGTFWFFDPANIEVVVKVLDACVPFERFWVFAGALTDVEAAVVITDSSTGRARVYFNPANTPFQPVQDTDAFASCP